MARIQVDFEDENLKKNLQNFDRDLNRKIAMVMDYNSSYATGWMKQNAPWHDNTGAARTGLTALSFSVNNVHEIIMAYSVYYGIWLEVAHSGRWAIITPAMRIIGNKVMRDLQLLIASIGK